MLIEYLDFASNSDKVCLPLNQTELVILVGLTGVGKTTVTDALQKHITFTLLPNRRQVTDEFIIASLQKEDGEAVHPVTDRLKRLEYTARYRAQYPGGMAHALSRLAVDPQQVTFPLIFDGLRGQNEVQHALHFFPHARFLILDAPDSVRLNRLLNRGDAFDRINFDAVVGQDTLTALQAIPHIDLVFSPADLHKISQTTAELAVDDVVKKAALIVKERQNYDSQAARAFLTQHLPANRVLVIDTAAHAPAAIVEHIKPWLR
ncbi:MAG: AAA family ATPase [Anaerolineae bacterium]|nr:AAA family ATPase [Anaerolineae bacterium]